MYITDKLIFMSSLYYALRRDLMRRAKILMAMGALLVAGGMLANLPIAAAQGQTVRINMKASQYKFTPDTIRVKAGTQVEVHLVSTDVPHGFAIQALNVNVTVVPGKETVVRFTPAKAGTYPFICSVVCGPGHLDMKGQLIVE
jgi:heme/copper-type cytochrome/quinol oxidase subunit 2